MHHVMKIFSMESYSSSEIIVNKLNVPNPVIIYGEHYKSSLAVANNHDNLMMLGYYFEKQIPPLLFCTPCIRVCL